MKLILKFDENNIAWCRKEIFGIDYKKFNLRFLTTSCETLRIALEKLGFIHLSDIYREFCFDLPDENFIDYKITSKDAVLVRDELDDVYTITIEIPDSIKSWIPVKEKNPEEWGWYLVTIHSDEMNNTYVEVVEYIEDEWQFHSTICDDYEIIAWQKLPEPYVEED